jgi:hypothetical protein
MTIDPESLISPRKNAVYFSYRFNGKLVTFPAESEIDALQFLEELGAHLSHSKVNGADKSGPYGVRPLRSTSRVGR